MKGKKYLLAAAFLILCAGCTPEPKKETAQIDGNGQEVPSSVDQSVDSYEDGAPLPSDMVEDAAPALDEAAESVEEGFEGFDDELSTTPAIDQA